jgi:hypothetical protein
MESKGERSTRSPTSKIVIFSLAIVAIKIIKDIYRRYK